MTEQEKLLYNLVKDFVHAIDYDHLDWGDWPADSKEAFEKCSSGRKIIKEMYD